MRERRRLHIKAPGGRVVPLDVNFGEPAALKATVAAAPGMCAKFGAALEREDILNARAGAVHNASTERADGYRLTYWLQRTEATFALVIGGQSFTPTKQTLCVVAERDVAAPTALPSEPAS